MSDTAKRDRLKIGLMLAIATVSFAVYANSLTGGFVYDDIDNILGNRWITDTRYLYDIFTKHSAGFDVHFSARYYRPLIHVIFMLDYHLFGLDAWGYHLVSVVLHVITTLTVYLISLELLGVPRSGSHNAGTMAAFAAALLFALHPVHTEAVAWVSGVMDLAFSLFCLVSFYLYIKAFDGPRPRAWHYAISVAAFLAALLCKEPAVALPVIIFAYDRIYVKGSGRLSRDAVRYAPYAVVATAYFAFRWHVLGGFMQNKSPVSHGVYADLLNAFTLFSGYLGKLLFPLNLNAAYMYHPVDSVLDPKWVISFITAVAFAACVYAARRCRPVLMGIVIIIVPLAPALYLPVLGASGFADRYLYLPSAGFVVILASLTEFAVHLSRKRAAIVAVLLVLVSGAYATATVSRNPVWHDNYTLWADSVKKSPDNPFSHKVLGYALQEKGRLEEAVVEDNAALKLDPADADTHVNLGKVYRDMGRADKAFEQYVAALKIKPSLVEARYNLGNYYLDKGLYDEAIGHYRTVLDARPDYVLAYVNMGVAYYYMHNVGMAEKCLLEAIKLDPENAEARDKLGVLYAREGLFEKAAASFREAVRIDPANASYTKHLQDAMDALGSQR